MAIHVVNEARRCLHCKKPMCREGCPISTNIPEAIELFRTGHKEEAGEMLYENNPLSVICSLVCDHEKQCEGHCVLGRKGAPVHFSSIENYISDAYLDHLEPEMEPKKGQRVAIIGSGPAGLTAAIYASRARLQTLVLERDTMGAGQIAVTEQVDNYPGLPHIGGYELGEKFREHATELGTLFCENDVTHLEKKDGYFTATLEDHTELQARSVIYAAGTSYRRLEIAGGRLAGVSYCATCDGAFYQGKVVAVIGGGDTALEDALYLSRMAKTVYLVHRRDTFRANAALQEAVQKTENIVLVTNAVPTEITGEKRVETLKLLHGGSPEELSLDGVFVAIGSVPNTSLLEGVAELDSSGYVQAGEDGRTSVEGLFAAGDVRTKALRQVITAAADGANCVASAEKYLLENRG